MTLLSVENLSKLFGSQGHLFRDLTFELADGEILCLSAPSGYGKTTVLKCIAELVSYEGRIELSGKTASDIGIPEWRAQVQYVPQRAGLMAGTPIDYWKTVIDFKSHRDSIKDDPVLIGVRWNLPQRTWDQAWQSISGGERQRIVLAMCIALRPKLLLLDEPTSALDAVTTKLVEDTILEKKLSAIWISHAEEQIHRVSTRRLVLG